MTRSLSPEKNPLVRLYEFFGTSGVETEDNPNYLRVDLSIKRGGAHELAKFLSECSSNVLRVLQLRFDGRELADFAAQSVSDFFQWDTISELTAAKRLCESCAEIFDELRHRFDEYQSGAAWPQVNEESLAVLSDLENCPTCAPHLALEAAIDKQSAAAEFLIEELLNSGKTISALVWYDQPHMTAAFESFQEFLQFIGEKVDEPMVMFFYRRTELYRGNHFRIMSLSRPGAQTAELENEIARELGDYTTDVFVNYGMLRTDHKSEERPDLGQRFNIPPALFLGQSGELASYPSHPVFTSGPLRSLLIYSVMAWLARQTDGDDDTINFTLSADKHNPLKVSFDFSLHDVCQNEQSVFGNPDWREITGRVARDIEQSVGSEYFRDCWARSLGGLTAEDFTPDRFFTTLEAVRQSAETKRREPHADIQKLTPDLFLYVYLDTVNKLLLFQLGYVNPALGLGFERAFLKSPLDTVSVAELDELAKRNLVAILDIDPDKPLVRIPQMVKLTTRGETLWDDMIPRELKQEFIKLAAKKDLTILIFSEDRSFPWELIKPREYVGSKIVPAGFKDDWWALRFGIARWTPGAPPPANQLGITTVCCVAASSALSNAKREVEHFESLKPDGVSVYQPKTKEELMEFLSTQDYDVIHFACHGEFKTEDPGESAIQLPDGNLLRPDDLRERDIPQQIRNKHPLIFLNCCHSGRTGSTLVSIAGWANRLVDWGCGAFIGCGWEVADPLAAEFAIAFYKAFRDERKSLGQAVLQARTQVRERSIKERDLQNSTWLAYFLYGNPNCVYKD